MSASAPVNKILPYSVVDGPGNRVAIFVQKCNLHCLYCHNPETQNLCRNCGRCVDSCPAKALVWEEGKVVWKKEKCVGCDTCIKVCEYHASPKVTWMTAEEVFTEVRRSEPFIRGISVSGGECDLYPDFLKELFALAKQDHLTCLMDCNGTIDLSRQEELINLSDGVMLDVKSWDSEVFSRLTGGDEAMIRKNLTFLAELDKIEELRIVCLPGYVDAEETIEGIADTIGREKISTILLKLIRFRHFGVKGLLSDHASPGRDYMESLRKRALHAGFQKIMVI